MITLVECNHPSGKCESQASTGEEGKLNSSRKGKYFCLSYLQKNKRRRKTRVSVGKE